MLLHCHVDTQPHVISLVGAGPRTSTSTAVPPGAPGRAAGAAAARGRRQLVPATTALQRRCYHQGLGSSRSRIRSRSGACVTSTSLTPVLPCPQRRRHPQGRCQHQLLLAVAQPSKQQCHRHVRLARPRHQQATCCPLPVPYQGLWVRPAARVHNLVQGWAPRPALCPYPWAALCQGGCTPLRNRRPRCPTSLHMPCQHGQVPPPLPTVPPIIASCQVPGRQRRQALLQNHQQYLAARWCCWRGRISRRILPRRNSGEIWRIRGTMSRKIASSTAVLWRSPL